MTCTQLSPCINLPLKKEVLEDIIDKAKDWALMHGKKTYLNSSVIRIMCRECHLYTVRSRVPVYHLSYGCCPSWYHGI
jgi:hypothetical protein